MKKLAVLIAVPIAVLGVAAAMAIASAVTVGTTHTSLGTVLVSSNGHTLYLYEGDSGSHLGCTGKCLGFWPPVPASAKPAVSGGAVKADIGSIARGSSKQLTYKGHPLYWFYKDKKPGHVNGQGVVLNGKYWYAVSPAGAAMTASAGTGGSSSSGGSSSPAGERAEPSGAARAPHRSAIAARGVAEPTHSCGGTQARHAGRLSCGGCPNFPRPTMLAC